MTPESSGSADTALDPQNYLSVDIELGRIEHFVESFGVYHYTSASVVVDFKRFNTFFIRNLWKTYIWICTHDLVDSWIQGSVDTGPPDPKLQKGTDRAI